MHCDFFMHSIKARAASLHEVPIVLVFEHNDKVYGSTS